MPRGVAAVLLLPLLARAAPRPTWSTDPDKQPATRGEDGQRCAFGYLPGRVQLLGSPPGWAGVASDGTVCTRDEATLMDWSLDLYSWTQPAVRMILDNKLLYKSEVVKDPADLGGAWLDLWEEPRLRRVVALKDCDGVVMYVLRVRRGEPLPSKGDEPPRFTPQCDYEIYNQDGVLIAMSTCDPDSDYPDQVKFLDAQGAVITVAQTPAVEGGYIPFTNGENKYGVAVPKHAPAEREVEWRHSYGWMRPWDVWFVDGEPNAPSNSSLLLAQNRWVVVAAVLDLALRDAWEEVDTGSTLAGNMWLLGLVLRLSMLLLYVALLSLAFRCLHEVTFPPLDPALLAKHASVLAKPKARGTYATVPPHMAGGQVPSGPLAYGSFTTLPPQQVPG